MTAEWNKYRSLGNNQRTGHINYLIDPTLKNVDRLFVLAFETEEDRASFSKYYTPTI